MAQSDPATPDETPTRRDGFPPPPPSAPGAGSRAPILTLRQVTRRFGSTVAVERVSLAIRPGEVHVLLGPGGAGKTTLVRMLAGHLAPTAGTVRLVGEVANRRRQLSARVGLVPAGDRAFYLRLSGLENLIFFARLHGLRRREAAARARIVLAEMNLEALAERRVGTWSTGMRARLSIARAMIGEPDALLLDEATDELDPEAAHGIRVLVSLLATRGVAVVWTTQRVDEIRGFADAVTFIAGGSVCFSGPVAGLSPGERSERYVVRLRGTFPSGPMGRAMLQRTLEGTATASIPRAADPEHVVLQPREEHSIGDAIATLAQAGFVVLACRQERSELEEAFLALTAGAAG